MATKKNKNVMDDVLAFLQKDRHKETKKVFYKPDKGRSIGGFIASLIFFIIMFGFCIVKFSIGCVVLLGISIGLLMFYGANVFTKEGIWVQKYVDKKIIDKLEDENELNNLDSEEERKEQD